MKRLYKIISIFISILIITSLIYSIHAADIVDTNPFDQAKDFLQAGAEDVGMLEEMDRVSESVFGFNFGNTEIMEVIDFLWGIGLLAIFVTTVILGIKYMMVLPQEKSRVKQALTPYVIGTVIIFGALTIWKFIIVILEGSM